VRAGHLIFAELAKRTKGQDRERWIELCRNAADQIFSMDGKPLSIMPFHNEMSDAVFMAGPILATTGKLTGERKYFDAAVTHFASMRQQSRDTQRSRAGVASIMPQTDCSQRVASLS